MNILKNKRSNTFDYISRYSGVPYFFNTKKRREVYGIGSQISFDTPYVSHKVRTSDSLDSLSLEYYNDPTYWWAIAYFNKILDPFIILEQKYKVIKIPNLAGLKFED